MGVFSCHPSLIHYCTYCFEFWNSYVQREKAAQRALAWHNGMLSKNFSSLKNECIPQQKRPTHFLKRLLSFNLIKSLYWLFLILYVGKYFNVLLWCSLWTFCFESKSLLKIHLRGSVLLCLYATLCGFLTWCDISHNVDYFKFHKAKTQERERVSLLSFFCM